MTVSPDDFEVAAAKMGYLYDRWQDEKEHEDFGEYVAVLRKVLPARIENFKMSQKPFQATFKLDGHEVKIRATARRCSVEVTP